MANQKTQGGLIDFFLKTQLYAAYKRLTSALRTPILKMKGWKKIFHANGNPKKSGVAIFISVKVDFKPDCNKRQRRAL